jgi:hypothetical protein
MSNFIYWYANEIVWKSLFIMRHFAHVLVQHGNIRLNKFLNFLLTASRKVLLQNPKLDTCMPNRVPAQSKAWVYSGSLLGFCVRNPAGHGYLPLMSVLCCQVEVSASGWSLFERSSTEYGVSLIVIRCNNNTLGLQWVGRRGQTKE